ncbi:MAG: spermidine synthase [Acidobacteriota bacterium]
MKPIQAKIKPGTQNQVLELLPSFTLGFIALSLQILILREFSVQFAGNEITFGIMLGVWLFWTGIGSLSGSVFKFTQTKFSGFYYFVILVFPMCFIGLRLIRFLFKAGPGELMGLFPMILSALLISILICFPLGVLFVFNTQFLNGKISTVYLMESIGSAVGGIVVYFFLIPSLSNWKAACLIGLISGLIIFAAFQNIKKIFLFIGVLLMMSAFWTLDLPIQKLYWKPFSLAANKDSPYGKLQVIKTQEQITLYNNHSKVYSYPDLASAEQAVHFALLQKPEAKNVLLIGGGLSGSLHEILKYPKTRVDYVEVDPEVIQLSARFLPESQKYIHNHPRIKVYYEDGRVFIKNTQKSYHVIILNLPPPETAQLNRFYTQEFFQIVKSKLHPDGVFSFQVPSAENYISPQLQDFLSCLYFSLHSVFNEVKIVPGASNIFLASSHLKALDPDTFSHQIEELKLHNKYVSPYILRARLSPLRVQSLREKIISGKKRLNKDLFPISYFYNSVLRSTQFKGIETQLLSFLSKKGHFWLLDLPLLMFGVILIIIGFKKKKDYFYLTPLTLIGLTSIAVEVIVIIAFQTIYGYIYQTISILFAFFMAGMALGAYGGTKIKKVDTKHLIVIQFESLLLLFILFLSIKQTPPQLFFLLFLLLLGSVGGQMFIISNQLYLKKNLNYGLGYGLDLIGSFLGAITISSILIPLVGLLLVLGYLFLASSFCLLFLVWGRVKLNLNS